MAIFKKQKRKYVRKSKAKAKGKKVSFAKRVLSVIHKQAETKHVYQANNSIATNSQITAVGDVLQLLPNQVHGTSDHARIGDQIRAQKLTIKGFIRADLTVTGISSSRLGVRMMIVQPKQYNDLALIQTNAATWLQLLLKKGNTTTAFNGNIPDLMADINTDAITCYYDKVFYINAPYLLTAVGDVTVYNSVKFFSKTINLKGKVLKYDNNINAGLTPTNYNPVLILGYVKLDGTTADAVNQLSISTDSYLFYEDA